MRYKSLSKKEKEIRILDDITFFIEKLEKKYGVEILYNVDDII